MNAGDLLLESRNIVCGSRRSQYGSPERNLQRIAEQWTLYLTQRYGKDVKVSAEDVCWMMADLKKCRQMNATKIDNMVDAVGYISMIGELV